MTAPASRRFQTGSIFAAFAAASVYWGSYIASLPDLKTISGLSDARFGLLLTTTTIGGIIAMQALGRILHRVQALAIPACLVVFAAGMAVMATASGPVTLGAAMFLAGAASGALDISLNMRVARIETDFDLRLFNRVHALFPFCMLITSATVGFLRDAGATPAMIFPAGAAVLLAAALAEWRAGRHQKPLAAPAGRAGGRIRLGGVLMALGALAALGAIMEGGAHTWSALFVEGQLGGSPTTGGLAAAAITLGLTTGRLLAHRHEQRLRDMTIVRIAALFALPAFVILAVAPSPAVAILGFFLAGLGVGPIEPAVFRSVSKRHAEADRGRALALATGLAYVGYLTSPPVMGALIESLGWPAMWLTLIAFALAAIALASRIPPARG
jgi:predicted MFS family arabinose efflux permease